jgi:hypothetical protein
MRLPLLAVAPLLLLLAGCPAGPCPEASTCEGCVAMYVSEGCRWCPLENECTDSLADNTCDISTEVFDSDQCMETGGGSSSGSCTSSYQGPTGDPQVSTQCMSVWNYRCVQQDDSRADQNCLVYDSLEATVACPYCSGSSGGGGGGGGGGGSTPPANNCNTSGISPGCSSNYPYSCSASSRCYASVNDCANDTTCQQ